MARKRRIPVPVETDAEVLYAADRTCCVCRVPGRPLQIHHIDEDPSNNSVANLAALCLDCHHQTQITGGFARQLSAPLVTLYRDEWVRCVEAKRAGITSEPVQDGNAALLQKWQQELKQETPEERAARQRRLEKVIQEIINRKEFARALGICEMYLDFVPTNELWDLKAKALRGLGRERAARTAEKLASIMRD